MPHVPVGVMVPPIVKQASLYGYNNHDFDFFITLAKHPRLSLRHSLLLVDLLGKICLNDPLFGRVATVPFLILSKKYGEDEAMHEYMQQRAQQRSAQANRYATRGNRRRGRAYTRPLL